jgi:hypothetical protein
VNFPNVIRSQAARLAVGAIALTLFGAARVTSGNPAPAATSLRFEPVLIGSPARPDDRRLRPVNPRYRPIANWISAVGAAVAVADIDGDGRPNDVCHVDTREDSVSVFPAPGTQASYPAFRLPLPQGPYRAGATAPMGCLPGDFDEDGSVDLAIYFWGRPPLLYMAGSGPVGAEAFRPVELVAAREAWYTNAAIQADVDGDGHVDLLFGNYFPEDAAVLDSTARSGGVMQRSMSRAFNGGRNRLFLSDRASGTASGYTDHSSAFTSAMGAGWTLALAAADLDGDLRPEIYVANDFGPDRLLVNLSLPGHPRFTLAEGRRSFAEPRSRTIGRDSFKGMGAEFADLNGDGLLDLAVSNIAQEYALLESHFLFMNTGGSERLKQGVAPFRDESGPRGIARSGWGWDIKAADFDNDGRPEIFQALGFLAGRVNRWPELQELATANDDLLDNPAFWGAFSGDADLSGYQANRVYAPDRDGIYRDVGAGLDLGAPGVTRGIAVADVDLDGRLDAVVARQWEPSSLLRNRSRAGASLSLDLRLANANGTSRPAIGATARVLRGGRPPMIGLVDGGNGHSGKRAPIVHFGLGADRSPVEVSIEWRDEAGPNRSRVTLPPGHHRLVLRRKAA